MLNYANLMMRIIPKNKKKYDDLSHILSKYVQFEYSENGELLGEDEDDFDEDDSFEDDYLDKDEDDL